MRIRGAANLDSEMRYKQSGATLIRTKIRIADVLNLRIYVGVAVPKLIEGRLVRQEGIVREMCWFKLIPIDPVDFRRYLHPASKNIQ